VLTESERGSMSASGSLTEAWYQCDCSPLFFLLLEREPNPAPDRSLPNDALATMKVSKIEICDNAMCKSDHMLGK
jgi:hypothetical protein